MMSQHEPVCVVCGRPMHLLDEDEDRWYCYDDDVLVIRGVEVDSRGNPIHRVPTRSMQVAQTDRTHVFDQSAPQAPFVHCFYCGKKMPVDASFCRYCGRQQSVLE